MALFKRKKTETKNVPPEVKQYYQSEHRERVGLAWLIAFLSLILTIVVIAGLFFGGRWIYRKIANNDSPTVVEQSDSGQSNTAPSGSGSTPSQPNDLQPAAPSQNEGNGSSNSSSSNSDSDSSTSSDSNSNSSSSDSSSQSTPSDSEEEITNTGPGSTALIFLASSSIAAVGHSVYQRRKYAKQ